MPKLYLIPSLLSETDWNDVLPQKIKHVCSETKYFIVENIRTTRRFLKKLDKEINIDELIFFELNKRTTPEEIQKSLTPLIEGQNVGLVSEAGCPGIADPGAEIVKLAHQKDIQVVPMVGPSSILLALMASGMNGQNFAFVGYLPVKPNERVKRIKQLELKAKTEKQTQIFIETPYRNNQMTEDLLKSCNPSTLLCIACDLTSENEFISTKTIKEWKNKTPDLNKRPAIFMLYHE
ncbi:MAG: SAM-dependent methyltransferase [Mariniphaga sp.]|nr:SAM-dependent methyltransferase [Mariniphaga sp.]